MGRKSSVHRKDNVFTITSVSSSIQYLFIKDYGCENYVIALYRSIYFHMVHINFFAVNLFESFFRNPN